MPLPPTLVPLKPAEFEGLGTQGRLDAGDRRRTPRRHPEFGDRLGDRGCSSCVVVPSRPLLGDPMRPFSWRLGGERVPTTLAR